MEPTSVSRSLLVASIGASSSRSFNLAKPKSSSLTLSRVSMMLPGLRSACTTPCRCAWSSASAIWIATRNARSSGNGPSSSRAARVTPSTYSITRKIAGPSSPTSCSVQICGWVMRAMARASRRNRSILRPGAFKSSLGSSLMATVRSSRVSRARYTSPIPPAPSGVRISNGPRRAPDANLIEWG